MRRPPIPVVLLPLSLLCAGWSSGGAEPEPRPSPSGCADPGTAGCVVASDRQRARAPRVPEADARELVTTVLEHEGATVLTVGTAPEAFSRLTALKPDVLVCDISMPMEDGYSLIRRIRALAPERGGRTPAIALTTYAREEDRRKALAAGFEVHVPKPVDPAELVDVVARLTGRLSA